MFMPGIPQVWYLDLFAGKNDYVAADRGGTAGHKEINRTTLSTEEIEAGLSRPVVQDQLALIRLRNTSTAFDGELTVIRTDEQHLSLIWEHQESTASLKANLHDFSFIITCTDNVSGESVISYGL